MPIYKRNKKTGIRYFAVLEVAPGKQVSKTCKRKIDAETWLIEQKQLLFTAPPTNKSAVLENSNKTLKVFCQEWLQNYAMKNKAMSSVRLDSGIIKNQIDPILGRFRLNELTQEVIEKWLYHLRDQMGLAPKTCNDCFHLLKKILNDACRWRHLSNNEMRYLSAFKLQKRVPTFWTQEEAAKFLSYVVMFHEDLYPVYALALYTGLRRGEIQALKWDCVDLNRRALIVKRIYCAVEKKIIDRTKGKRDRAVPINQALFDMLSKQINKSGCSELVVPQFDWAHAYRTTARLCKKAGVASIRFHDLRHTFASNLVMQGRTLYDVQKLLGHSTSAMTEKYAHLSPEYLIGATDCLNFEPKERVGLKLVSKK